MHDVDRRDWADPGHGASSPIERLEGDLVGHGGPVKSIQVSEDGKKAVSASFDYSIVYWDLDSQTPIETYVEHEGAVNAVRFLPEDGAALSGGGAAGR